jgi:hypothetical protein
MIRVWCAYFEAFPNPHLPQNTLGDYDLPIQIETVGHHAGFSASPLSVPVQSSAGFAKRAHYFTLSLLRDLFKHLQTSIHQLIVQGHLIVLRSLHAIESQQQHGCHVRATRRPIAGY